jgi:leucyl-tRNA synthetase
MKEQYSTIGASFSFKNEVITCLPEYYKWNQWIFIKMFERGIAYQDKTLSNWCPNDQTVLANEHVEDGKCWRCGTEVVQKEVEQWFLKITEYADRLLWNEKKVENVDWPLEVRLGQNNWIGKSEGALITFKIDRTDCEINVFTTRPDTLYGATFMVLAPEHPLITALLTKNGKKSKNSQKSKKTGKKITDPEGIYSDIVFPEVTSPIFENLKKYVVDSSKKTELERKESREKTGVLTGLTAVNPASGEKIPVWVADYVLAGYGTGAIFGDAHDERDVEFAKKYNIRLKPTLITGDSKHDSKIKSLKEIFSGEGILFDSGEFSGLRSDEAKTKITDWLEQKGLGKREIQYHLHDWSVSRQRYWGTPVPMIHCDNCGTVPVPLDLLPVELPYDVDYAPKGKPPLASNEKWLSTKCPNCGGDAKRDPETLDTFFDSSWYMFRFLSPFYDEGPFNPEIEKKAMPVDIYFGGAEHTLGHTLYSRFFTKFFKDLGLTQNSEYASRRVNHGVILGPDGNRMSKSKGNVVNPDDEVKKYGADTIRVYLAFFMPYDATGPWISDRVWGAHRFLQRIWGLFDKVGSSSNLSAEDMRQMHKAIKKVSEDIEAVKYNTAVAALMEWLNHLSRKEEVSHEEFEVMLKLLSPFAPHITEELWHRLPDVDASKSIHREEWPVFDAKYLTTDQVIVVVQVNGKRRAEISIDSSQTSNKEYIEKSAIEEAPNYLKGQEIRKVIHIPGKIVNFVV